VFGDLALDLFPFLPVMFCNNWLCSDLSIHFTIGFGDLALDLCCSHVYVVGSINTFHLLGLEI
jgi:hypothetical protein